MNLDRASIPIATSHQAPNQTDTRLRGGWLVLVRAAWILIVTLSLAVSIADLPLEFRRLHTICVGSSCDDQQLTAGIVQDLHHLDLSVDFFATYLVIFGFGSLLVWVVVALLIFWRKSDDRMALLVALFLVLFPAAQILGSPAYVGAAYPSLHVLTTFLDTLGWLSLLLFFFLFPDGRFVPRWTGVLVGAYMLLNLLVGLFPSLPTADTVSLLLGLPLLAAMVGTGLVSQFYRYRRISSVVQRQQTKWVIYGVVTTILLFTGVVSLGQVFFSRPHLVPLLVASTAIYGCELLIPLSISFSILRYRLWDIDLIINRTLVYSTLTASIIALYVLVVVSLGALLQTSGNLLISLLATGLIAVLFQPLRGRLQKAINHLMYGERDEPYAVMTRLSQRLAVALVPDGVLSTIVETVAQALKLPYAAILLKREQAFVVVASYGQPSEIPLILPLVYQAETIGQLHLAPRTPGEAFSPADKRLLDELARHAGLAAHAVRLTSDLQHAREHLVTAREEERRRLRRDLHDGLGSALTSVMFKLDATDELLERDPAKARALLADVRVQTQASITDIRRLVYNLRPPILDEWGLVAALREHVAQYALQNVQVSLDAPESFPPLSAAVEVAVYRMVLEALANVIKHAQATTCTIRLTLLDDALTAEVQDNGVGRPPGFHTGVGMTAMYERAAELGGTCLIEDAVPRGTRVYACFPLIRSDAR
jgi:signal transduction histidine kinase